jgi:transcription termination factor Rho
MTDINDANPTLENGTNEVQPQALPPSEPAAPKAKRNSRRTPRRQIDDANLLFPTPVAATPKRRSTRSRHTDDYHEDNLVVEAPEASVKTPDEARRDTRNEPKGGSYLSDEIALPASATSISVPKRNVEDVPVRYSSDEDDGAPDKSVGVSDAARDDKRDEDDYHSQGKTAAERRRDRRNARFADSSDGGDRYNDREDSSQDGEYPEDRASHAEPENDSRDGESYDSGDRDDSGAGHENSREEDRGESREREEPQDSDSESDRDESAESSDENGDDSRGGSVDSDRPAEGARDQNREYNNNQQGDRYRHGNGGYNNYQQGYDNRHLSKRQKFKLKKQMQRQQQGGGQNYPQRQQQQGGGQSQHNWNNDRNQPRPQRRSRNEFFGREDNAFIEIGELPELESLRDVEVMEKLAAEHEDGGEAIDLIQLLMANIHDLMTRARDEFKVPMEGMPIRAQIVEGILNAAWEAKRAVTVEGVVEAAQDGWGLLTYQHDNYRVRPLCAFIPRVTMKRFGLKRGHIVKAVIQPPRKELTLDGNKENCPAVLKIVEIMGRDPTLNLQTVPFEDLTPYYPKERFLLETSPDVKWDNVSMRVVDLLTPVGKGQRGLIVAPPRTGKTILQQGIANAIMTNNPESHLIVLLVDERPEEVTDFRRQIASGGEVIASTFDENAESHVHAAEMVIEKARRMVEVGKHVVILLDSITRLARAYNTLAGNSGKILSGGVEATAMQKPKRFFGSARNIEGGGSLTILGTALVETGSRMDEVIFEEFKGTGNMELVLDRALVDKRIFPAINLEKSGTRKEELLYHPDELVKVYGLRRAMKGVPSPDAMEMLIGRVKKTKTNIEFLMGLNR